MPISTEFTQKDSMTILSPFNLKLDENMLPQEPNLSLEANKGDLLLYKGKEFIILNEALTFGKFFLW